MGLWNLKKVASTLDGLRIAEGREVENLAGWIWEEIMGLSKLAEANLGATEEERIFNAIDRLAAGEPVQYIAGHAWFYGIKLKVTPEVLIPRPETEELVHWILSDIKNSRGKEIRILDIGTGSGCIAIALKKHLKNPASILAADISVHALEVARENALLTGVDINFIQQDFLKEGLHDLGMFDIIVSNPPYISLPLAGEEITNRLSYEPALALYPMGEDPDIFYKRIAASGMVSLFPGAACFIEMNEFRADQIQSYFRDLGWSYIETRKDRPANNKSMATRPPRKYNHKKEVTKYFAVRSWLFARYPLSKASDQKKIIRYPQSISISMVPTDSTGRKRAITMDERIMPD